MKQGCEWVDYQKQRADRLECRLKCKTDPRRVVMVSTKEMENGDDQKRTKQKVLAAWLAGWHYMPIVKFNLDCSLQNAFFFLYSFFSFGNGEKYKLFFDAEAISFVHKLVYCVYVERGLAFIHSYRVWAS